MFYKILVLFHYLVKDIFLYDVRDMIPYMYGGIFFVFTAVQYIHFTAVHCTVLLNVVRTYII